MNTMTNQLVRQGRLRPREESVTDGRVNVESEVRAVGDAASGDETVGADEAVEGK